MVSGRDLKKNLIQRTENRDVDSVLQLLTKKTQRLKDALENAHYQSIESIDIKTTYIAAGTGFVTRGVRHLDEKIALQRKEIHCVNTATQEQTAILRSQDERMDRIVSFLEALVNNKNVIADANLKRVGEAAPEDFGPWMSNKIMDALIEHRSTFSHLKENLRASIC